DQVHDLADAAARDVPQPRDLRIAVDLPRPDQLVEVERQRHQARHARHAPRGRRPRRLPAGPQLLAALGALVEVDLAFDRQRNVHALFSFARCRASSSASVWMPDGWNVMDTLPWLPSYSTRATRSWTTRACSRGVSDAHTGSKTDRARVRSASSSHS